MGLGQIPTGHLADRIGRKPLIIYGMLVQTVGFVLALALLERPLLAGLLSAVFLGLGTAMVYPDLIAAAVLTAASGLLAARWIAEHTKD